MTQTRHRTLVERYAWPPDEIGARSFALIEAMIPPLPISAAEREVVRRMVHASGDPGLAPLVRIHPKAVEAGVAALQAGRTIFTDVTMIVAGINPFWQLIAVGFVLLISVGLDQFARSRSRV